MTIANLAPATPADLQALVVQRLSDIEADLRGLDTYLVSQFWNMLSESPSPHDENFCRNLLLDKLRDRLKHLQIHATRESSAAANKRADVRAEFIRTDQRIALPIEVKKENHRELWTAWRDQLQSLYAIDPAADGYGLYLVIWFGHSPRPTPEGVKPVDASHMQDLIVERIPEAERHRLGALVLELSLAGSTRPVGGRSANSHHIA